jgi:hypothetical protein
VAVLDPDVVARADFGPAGGSQEVRGAEAVARRALSYARAGAGEVRPALINGAAGFVGFLDGRLFSIAAVTVRNGKIVELDFFNDPEPAPPPRPDHPRRLTETRSGPTRAQRTRIARPTNRICPGEHGA